MAARQPTPKQSQPSGKRLATHLPRPYKLRSFYTPEEVAKHNTADDCWVSFFYEVYDLTQLIQDNILLEACKPLIAAAGTDISHCLDYDTREPKMAIDPLTNVNWFYCPMGRYLHIPPLMPDSEWDPSSFKEPWWRDINLRVGRLTEKTRKIRIFNQLTKADDVIEVCSEETMNEILDRYLELNEHAASYTWKRLGRPLDMDQTMEENDIPDESKDFIDLNLDEDSYIPCVHLYYNDDLTVA